MVAPRHRIGYIDGLRAVAVLAVLAYHAIPSGAASIGAPIGVALFFVISGFCLSYPTLLKLHLEGTATFNVPRYAARRVVRIVPPYYLAIAFLLAFAAVLSRFGYALPSSMPQSGISWNDILRQIFFLDNNIRYLDWSFWTLPVEFRWYFVFPIALWVWIRSPIAFLPLIGALIIAQSTLASSIDIIVLPAFLSGIVAAHLRIYPHPLARLAPIPALSLCVIAYQQNRSFITPLWEVSMFLLVVSAGASIWLQRILSIRWVAAIGLASYSIYLIHQPLVRFAETLGASPALAALLTLACASAFWYAAERPFVETGVRTRLLSQLQPAFSKWFARFGIGGTLRFASGGSSETTSPLTEANNPPESPMSLA